MGAKIKKAYGRSKATMIAGIVLLAAAVILMLIGAFRYGAEKKNVPYLEDIIQEKGTDKLGRASYLDINGCFAFAGNGESTYYIAYNDDWYYIISAGEKGEEYLDRQFEESGDGPIRIYGWTIAIPEEAKPFAVETFNEEYGEEVISLEDFDDVFGDVCLSVHDEKAVFGADGFMRVSGGYVIGALFTLAAGLLAFLLGRARMKSFAPVLEPESDLMRELESPDTIHLDGVSTYLTENYVASLTGGFDAVRYTDIFWVYVTRHSTNGVHDYDYLTAVTRDGKQYSLATGGSFGRKRKAATADTHNQIIQTIHIKNPGVLIGYNKENLEACKALQKQIKEEKKAGIR